MVFLLANAGISLQWVASQGLGCTEPQLWALLAPPPSHRAASKGGLAELSAQVVSDSNRAGLQQLLPQSWAVLHCPSQRFILVTGGGRGMGNAIKGIPASHPNLVKLFWRSNPGELIVCSEVCLPALPKEISFCLLKHRMSQKDK